MKTMIKVMSHNNGTAWAWRVIRERLRARNDFMLCLFDESGKCFTSRKDALADAEAFKASVAETKIVVAKA